MKNIEPNKKWVVFFGEDWGRHNSTGQYIARGLTNKYNVLWVNSLGLRTPGLNFSDISRSFKKIKQFILSYFCNDKKELSNKNSGLVVASPLSIPLYGFKVIRRINTSLVSYYLNRYLRELNIIRPLVITACPSTVDIVDKIDSRGIVYYCADEHSELPGMNRDLVIALEKELINKVDCIFVSSMALQESKSELHNNVEYLPHGVNYEHFSSALRKTDKKPVDIKNNGKPVIGYIGLIGQHLDFGLIEYVAKKLSHYDFVFIGPIEEGLLGAIPKETNIKYIGPRNYDCLPEYLAEFDVCILPWLDTKRNCYANPTKLREYIASGCPVVSTSHPEIKAIKGTIYYGDTKEEFVNNLRAAIEEKKSFDRVEQSANMKNDTWHERIMKMNKIIDKL